LRKRSSSVGSEESEGQGRTRGRSGSRGSLGGGAEDDDEENNPAQVALSVLKTDHFTTLEDVSGFPIENLPSSEMEFPQQTNRENSNSPMSHDL
jgi:hypothetical protein